MLSPTPVTPSIHSLTEEQNDLVEMVRDYAGTALAPHSLEWDRDHFFPVETIKQAGELGFGGIYVAEERGGAGLTRSDAALIFEELAQGDVAVAAYISIHNMVAWMIDAYGDASQQERWVPALASMQHLGSYCLTEPDAGSDAAALSTRAVRDGDEYVLTGTKQFISGAGATDVLVVMARTGAAGASGITAFIVDAHAEGIHYGEAERKMGWNAQPTRAVTFDGVRVPAVDRLGAEGEGFGIAMSALNGGRLNIAACSIGGAQWALDRAAKHITERHAFGAPLSQQQSLVFTIADMETELQAARLLLRSAAHSLDTGHPDLIAHCAMAKRFATDIAFTAANAALQLHGGYGYLAEYGIEKVVRDLRVHQILEGSNEIMKLIIGRSVLGRVS
ncbi:acyl-CoA dehydrogenase family protein [Microcella daejeonensis]|uniref:Acyl-CoA dehydrogenase family protein n=1 Tax=Microcella daejeonensis TaxID=2994971 RepID=A0A9E8MN47_9MICO|nr:acyl-CoA dehydrogenase family protein [Microcella daejeonensis]WAB82563.1 acyl-CoA dehydrogenase family protein [Microcella daejeonensis]